MMKLVLQRAIPIDSPLAEGLRESGKLIPNWWFSGITEGVGWIVDVYRGGYCYVAVGKSSENLRSIPAVIRFLRTHLAARGVRI